jgi:hypothetical protein
VRGPAHTLRVALANVPWPLDPALARTRDETTLVRTLFSTPLRVDPRTGDIAPGLCTTWQAEQGGRVWRFRCTHAEAIGAQLRRVAHIAESPGYWMFARATQISSTGTFLEIRLRSPWLRFPYALTAASSAPRDVPGPFRVVTARGGRIVARRGALTLRVTQIAPHRAAVLFRNGRLDEAPVPLGDIRAALADATVAKAVRVRPLLAVDTVFFDRFQASLRDFPNARRVYWQTAGRVDYQALVPEGEASVALSFVPGYGEDRTSGSVYRAAKARIPSLPPVSVDVAAEVGDPTLRYGASLLVASWRDLGLGARDWTAGFPGALLARIAAPYPQEEALVAQLAPADALLRAVTQTRALRRADEELYASAKVVPVAWAVDARFVSPRVRGWREDRLGDVDYTRVTLDARR